MEFEYSRKTKMYMEQLTDFMGKHIYPNEKTFKDQLDGSSDRGVFFKICLPQVRAGLAATAVFGLILTWNEFLFALLLGGIQTRTVPVAMAQTIGGDIGVRWGLLAAIETLFLIPVILVTFALQEYLLRGVTFGTIRR